MAEERGTGADVTRAALANATAAQLAIAAQSRIPARMENQPERPGVPKQTVRQRLFWFLVGAVVNYVLISTPFKWLRQAHPDWPIPLISGCSVGVSTIFFFFWNYFVNFRTDSRKRSAFARYVTAVVMFWAVSSTLLTIFKLFNAGLAFRLGKLPIDLDVVATQACMGPLKFIIYHWWAFPAAKPGAK